MSTTENRITAEDARMWGREAHEMGLTVERATSDIAECGCPAFLLPEVILAYETAKRQASYREA